MELMPEVRMDLVDDDIFDDEEPLDDIGEKDESLGPPIVEAQILEEDIFEQASPPQETPEVTPLVEKKPRKKRKPMTEAQKASLAKARVKALETRRRKAKERKELQALTVLKEQKDLKNLKEYVADTTPPPHGPTVPNTTSKEKSITKEDLEDAQLQAIMKYDTLRKKEKKIKKENEAKNAQEERVKQRIRSAIEPQRQFQYGQSGYFDNCF